MKVALCLSGQPRCVKETYPYIYENIIKPNNADVFIHMNYSKKNTYIEKTHIGRDNCILEEGLDEVVYNLYKPLQFLVEEPKNFIKSNLKIPEKRLDNMIELNKDKGWSREEHKRHIVKQMCSMFYSIFKCNELKENYANQNGIIYDYVIRLRFDAVPRVPLCCSNYEPSFIYYQNLGQPDNLISDWINFGSNSIMNIYCSVYLMLDYLNSFQFFKKDDRDINTIEPSDIVGGFSEYLIRDIMKLFKIPSKSFDIGCYLKYL